MKNTRTNEETNVTDFYDTKRAQLDLDGLASISKDVKNSIAYVSDNQARFIIDNYYATQAHRISIANQIRAVEQGFDQVQDGDQPAIAWLLKDVQNRENQIKKMITEYTKTTPVCQWATQIKGIGPVFAANLWSYIDMSKCKHANQWLSYAGQNDNNVPWLGKDKSDKIVKKIYSDLGMKNSDPVNQDVFIEISKASGRTITSVMRGYKSFRDKNSGGNDRDALIKFLSKPPYNLELKKICYLIGEAFVKVSNRGSLYGQLYKERKALETMKNENGDYAEQAARILKEKNFSNDTVTKRLLLEGKLSPAHINSRAKRYAVKIFLTHFFEACYIYVNQKQPPVIYPIAHMDHEDYIEPEVPYDSLWL